MGKIIGLDLGTKTLGVAISDSAGWMAYGRENFRFAPGNYKAALEHVLDLCKKEDVRELCLGLPLHMSGQMSERAESSLRFKDQLLAADPTLKIVMVDERMTTKIATNRLLEADLSRRKRKEVIDKMAAVVILESYLAMRK